MLSRTGRLVLAYLTMRIALGILRLYSMMYGLLMRKFSMQIVSSAKVASNGEVTMLVMTTGATTVMTMANVIVTFVSATLGSSVLKMVVGSSIRRIGVLPKVDLTKGSRIELRRELITRTTPDVTISVVAVDVNTRAAPEVIESAKAKSSALRVLRTDSKKAFSFAKT